MRPLLIGGLIIGGALAFLAVDYVSRRRLTAQAALVARERRGKPLLNVGCATHSDFVDAGYMIERADINLDIRPLHDYVPNFVQGDIENLWMFEDKVFGVAYASHVMEHLNDYHQGMSELHRVADEVYTVLPRWWSPSNYLNNKHKWIFPIGIPVRRQRIPERIYSAELMGGLGHLLKAGNSHQLRPQITSSRV